MQRPYLKGRDLFDLAWYLSDPAWPAPNLALLNNALRQTRHDGPELKARTWRRAVAARLALADLERARKDVEPFLEARSDLDLITAESLQRVLRG